MTLGVIAPNKSIIARTRITASPSTIVRPPTNILSLIRSTFLPPWPVMNVNLEYPSYSDVKSWCHCLTLEWRAQRIDTSNTNVRHNTDVRPNPRATQIKVKSLHLYGPRVLARCEAVIAVVVDPRYGDRFLKIRCYRGEEWEERQFGLMTVLPSLPKGSCLMTATFNPSSGCTQPTMFDLAHASIAAYNHAPYNGYRGFKHQSIWFVKSIMDILLHAEIETGHRAPSRAIRNGGGGWSVKASYAIARIEKNLELELAVVRKEFDKGREKDRGTPGRRQVSENERALNAVILDFQIRRTETEAKVCCFL